MNPNLQDQQSKPKASKPEDPGEFVYFLLVSDEYEEEAARAYLDAKYGPGGRHTSKRVVELRSGRLTEKHTVIPVFRANVEDGITKLVDEESKRIVTARMDPTRGVIEGKPVHCCNHWVPSEHEDGDGVLNMSSFLQELGISCSPPGLNKKTTPPAPRYRPDDQILRLRLT